MFNQIAGGNQLPNYLSSDNDALFLFHRWKSNLRVLEIGELKSIPGTPTSHPFIERVIGTTRRECLDQLFFFNKLDLQRKLDYFQDYYNEDRVHSSLDLKTPGGNRIENKRIGVKNRGQDDCFIILLITSPIREANPFPSRFFFLKRGLGLITFQHRHSARHRCYVTLTPPQRSGASRTLFLKPSRCHEIPH
jgi:hypothetical protein